MDCFYTKYIEKENAYYRTLRPGTPKDGTLSPEVLNRAVDWLCRDSRAVLDFGCGSGGLSFACALRGVDSVLGIDGAEEGVRYARACGEALPQCRFLQGSVELLKDLQEGQFDGLILSNILDNLRPEDSADVLRESARALAPGGKALVKLNPFLTAWQIQEWNIRVLEEDLLDDGLLLWNKPDAFWVETLSRYYSEIRQLDVYYQEADQHNRLFLCVK